MFVESTTSRAWTGVVMVGSRLPDSIWVAFFFFQGNTRSRILALHLRTTVDPIDTQSQAEDIQRHP